MPKGLRGFQKGNVYGKKVPWNKSRKGLQKHSEETKLKIRLARAKQVITPETRKKMSIIRKGKSAYWLVGKPSWNKGKKFSEETKIKMSLAKKGITPWNKGKTGVQIGKRGSESNLWRGGVSSEHHLIRESSEYKLWRKLVFERDNFTCILCNTKGGWNKKLKKNIPIQADHIKPFALFPELRFAIDNGRTLCIPCHKNTDTYGWKTYNLKYRKE